MEDRGNHRCPGPGWDDYAAVDTHPVPAFLREDHYRYLGSEPIAASRYTSAEFFQLELDKMHKEREQHQRQNGGHGPGPGPGI